MDPVEKENEIIRRLLETCDVSSDEPDDDDDSGEEDNSEVRHKSTDTELEMSDVASENELDTDDLDCYTGKNGETVWKKSKPQSKCKNSRSQHYYGADGCEMLKFQRIVGAVFLMKV